MEKGGAVILVLAAVVLASGCIGGGKEEKIKCPLSIVNPSECETGVVLVEDTGGCRLIKCKENILETDRIIEDLSLDYTPPEIKKTTAEESEVVAREYVLASDEYTQVAGYNLQLDTIERGACPYCWMYTFRFDGDSRAGGNTVDENTMTVSLDGGVVKEFSLEVTAKGCTTTNDCTAGDAPMGSQFACEQGICEKRNYANIAASHCLSRGGRGEVRVYDDGTREGYCVFPDGSECEEWEFYEGKCEPNMKIRDCREYDGIHYCSVDEKYDPVCAKVYIYNSTAEPIIDEERWEEFDNACQACVSETYDREIAGYKRGECGKTIEL